MAYTIALLLRAGNDSTASSWSHSIILNTLSSLQICFSSSNTALVSIIDH